MKVPREIGASELIRGLRVLGYEPVTPIFGVGFL